MRHFRAKSQHLDTLVKCLFLPLPFFPLPAGAPSPFLSCLFAVFGLCHCVVRLALRGLCASVDCGRKPEGKTRTNFVLATCCK